MNPEGAAWCGQCYASFEEAPADAPVTATSDGELDATAEDPLPGSVKTRTADADEQDARDISDEIVTTPAGEGFRRTEDGLEWRCIGCETWHDMDVAVCEVCGTAFGAAWTPDEADVSEERWREARMRTFFLPGLGHLHVGAGGPGLARAGLFLLWLVSGLALGLAGGAGVIAAAPLLLGAFTLYGTSVLDIASRQRGAKELLVGRSLLWLVVGVTAATLATIVVAALLAGPSPA